jgi:hemerythrin-like domain-containing protein
MSSAIARKDVWIGSAVGLGLGLAANFVRKTIVQAPTLFAGNWVEALTKEHQATLSLIDAIEATDADDAGHRTVLLTQLKHALGKHAFQEENAIYPALRERGLLEPEEELVREHAAVKHFLYRLTVLERSDPAWIATVREMRAALQEHMADEEATVFPKLQSLLSEEDNARLTQAMNREGFKLA